MEVQRKNLLQLFIPICIETMFYMLAGMADTLILSSVGDYAVGATGTANTYIGLFIIMISILSSGMVAVMSQNIGAGKPGVAYQARQIGLPTAMETILYNIAMTLVIRFLNQMDSDGINVTARSYTAQITNFSYCVAAALAQANVIMTGWRIGAEEYEECDRGTRKAALIGIIAGVGIETIFMFLCAVSGTYLFGVRLEWMAIGAYMGLASDECCRAVCMALRWKSGKWREKRLV